MLLAVMDDGPDPLSVELTVEGCDEADCPLSELVESWLSIDGKDPLEPGLPDTFDPELGSWLDPVDGTLLAAAEDGADSLTSLAELASDCLDEPDCKLCDGTELIESPLLPPLNGLSELI